MATNTGTLEALSKLHDHTRDDPTTHDLVHEVAMNLLGEHNVDRQHIELAHWRPGWGARD